MGKTIAMQPFISFSVDQPREDIIQPDTGWLDCMDFRHLTVDVWLMQITAATSTTLPELVLETSQNPTGPWTEFTTRYTSPTATPTTTTYTDDDATDILRRYVRWRIDFTSTSFTDLEMTFRIGAIMRGS